MSEEFSSRPHAGDPSADGQSGEDPSAGRQSREEPPADGQSGEEPPAGRQSGEEPPAGGRSREEPPAGGRAPGDDFQQAFWAAKHALSTATATAFSRHGVHEGQQFILRCLWTEDGLTPGEIARRLGLATPTVTRAATRMEAAGLLRREPHPGDRRLVRLRLTDRGSSLEEAIAAETAKLTELALATFEPDEREMVIRALRAIRRNLTA
jgi:DNA-binding MarR family transcriptional regulator